MDEWSQITWTEARQIVDLMEIEEAARPDPEVRPRDHYARLRDSGDLENAMLFLGHALPRFEGAAWAAHRLEELARDTELGTGDRQALDYSLRWVGDPSDEHRRAAFAAHEAAGAGSAERLLALAVFMTGGSLAPEDLTPVLPEPHLSGRLAASALIVAAHRSGDAQRSMRRSLELGERIADAGLEALSTR
jgi:hypothetical protein